MPYCRRHGYTGPQYWLSTGKCAICEAEDTPWIEREWMWARMRLYIVWDALTAWVRRQVGGG